MDNSKLRERVELVKAMNLVILSISDSSIYDYNWCHLIPQEYSSDDDIERLVINEEIFKTVLCTFRDLLYLFHDYKFKVGNEKY